ncbi:MAG: hypothetical protein AAFN17_01910 [Pseudomonadota bacterium]
MEYGDNEFATWLKIAEAPAVAVVNSTSDEAFLRKVVTSEARSITVFADRKVASEVAFVSNDAFVAQPRINIFKNLRAEFDTMLTGMDGPPVVLPFRVVREFATSRAKRVAREVEIIAGYPAAPELVLKCALDELRALIAQIARRGRRPLVIQDRTGMFEGMEKTEIAWFGPDFLRCDAPPASSQPHEALEEEVLSTVTEEMILAHANFLADTDTVTLRRMAPLLAEPAFAPIRDFWTEQLRSLKSVEFADWLEERALRNLNEAFKPQAKERR